MMAKPILSPTAIVAERQIAGNAPVTIPIVRRKHTGHKVITTSFGALAFPAWNITAPLPLWWERQNKMTAAWWWGGASLLISAWVATRSAEAQPASANMTTAQSNYVEYCAGCHGIQGTSAPAPVPELRGRVGYFLCSAAGREYLIRLPNVAHAPVSDPQDLADLMNFVVFNLGKGSVPKNAVKFNSDEIMRLRKVPMTPGTSLKQERARIVGDLIIHCNAPDTLNKNYN